MDNLKNIIDNNRAQFDNFEPENGHFERFQQKIKKGKDRKKSIIYPALRIAAVALIIILAGMLIFTRSLIHDIKLQATSANSELKEVQVYYTNLTNQKYNEIRSLDLPDNEQKKMLMDELKQMDNVYQVLMKDLKTNPNDERIINALIQHYQLKLDVMNQILNQLYNVKSSKSKKSKKSKKYETTKI